MTEEEDEDDAGASAPAVVDLRDRFRPVGDQGRRGTCVAFAVTALHEADRGPDGDHGLPEDLAEEVLFWGAKQIDGDRTDGTRFTSANLALQRWGQPAEQLWPYDDGRDHRAASYQPPAAAIDPLNCHLSALSPITADIDRVRSQLDAGRPVVLGIPVWDGFRRADREPLPPPQPGDIYPTRHAVVVVGHDPAANAVLIRNSWGSDWGNDGHLWVDAGLLTLATGAWTVDTATTSMGSAAHPDDEVLT
jgi:C1A family cysteine protease